MIATLNLQPVDVDGCEVGVQASDGTPIYKQWRIMASSPQLRQALAELRCTGHIHARCEGRETSRTAYYPRKLAELVHAGLDAHEASRSEPAPAFASVSAVPAYAATAFADRPTAVHRIEVLPSSGCLRP